MQNPLVEVLTPAARKTIYAAYALIGLVLGATQVGFSAAGQGQPTWLTVVLAIFAFIGTALGATAASNVQPEKTPVPANG